MHNSVAYLLAFNNMLVISLVIAFIILSFEFISIKRKSMSEIDEFKRDIYKKIAYSINVAQSILMITTIIMV